MSAYSQLNARRRDVGPLHVTYMAVIQRYRQISALLYMKRRHLSRER